MKIGMGSDFHGQLPNVPGRYDLFLLAGDLFPNFSRDKIIDAQRQADWFVSNLIPWINKIDSDQIYAIFGNHCTLGDHLPKNTLNEILGQLNPNCGWLTDESAEFGNHKIYGTPWVKPVGKWSFLAKPEQMKILRNQIPSDTTILLSHSPPYGILDYIPHCGINVGDEELNYTIADRLHNLKLVVVGHIHECGNRQVNINGINYINTAEHIMEINL